MTMGASIALSSSLLLLGAGSAVADSVGNSLDGSVDSSLETMKLVAAGADGSVNFSVKGRDFDGHDGCNLSADAALTVGVASSDPTVATVEPASLVFSNCTDVKTVKVKPLNPGQARVTLSQTTNASSGFFDLASASFLVIVAQTPSTDTTPPVITASVTPAPNDKGWNMADVTVAWSVTDPESAVTLKKGCDTTVISKDKRVKLTCVATSAGGMGKQSVTVKLDKTAPQVRIAAPADGAEYALNQKVSAKWAAADKGSGVAEATGTLANGARIDTSVAGSFSFSVTAKDVAGNMVTKVVTYTVSSTPQDDDDDNDDDEDDDEDADDEDKDKDRRAHDRKVILCHKSHASIVVSSSAMKAHLKHGDVVGACKK